MPGSSKKSDDLVITVGGTGRDREAGGAAGAFGGRGASLGAAGAGAAGSAGGGPGFWGPPYDAESAVLQGASTTYQPLAGLLQGRTGPEPVFVLLAKGAAALDRLTVSLYVRPPARLALLLFLVLLHLLILMML
jgi:hypothetical protein